MTVNNTDIVTAAAPAVEDAEVLTASPAFLQLLASGNDPTAAVIAVTTATAASTAAVIFLAEQELLRSAPAAPVAHTRPSWPLQSLSSAAATDSVTHSNSGSRSRANISNINININNINTVPRVVSGR